MRGCASSPSVSSPAGCACDSYPCTSAQPDPSAQGEIGGASICEHYRASPAIPGGPARVLQAPEFVWSSGSGSFPGARAARHLAVFRWRKRPPAPPAGPATAAFAWFALTSHQKRSQKRSASRRRCRERKQWKILFCNWPQVVSVVGFVVLNVHRFAAQTRLPCRAPPPGKEGPERFGECAGSGIVRVPLHRRERRVTSGYRFPKFGGLKFG